MNFYPPTLPFGSNEERLTSEALAVAAIPGAVLQNTVRPPLNIDPFPPRYGYDRRAIGIDEVVGIYRTFPDKRTFLSGTPSSYSGSARNAEGVW